MKNTVWAYYLLRLEKNKKKLINKGARNDTANFDIPDRSIYAGRL